MRPPDELPPFGDLDTPPPPPPPTLPPSAVPTPGYPTPPPDFGPLAPLATPNPRPELGDDGKAEERSGDDPTNEDDPPRQLIDLTGGGSGTSGGSDATGDASSGSIAASIAELARTAGEAVKTFAFPLSLTVLVVIFLLIQGEIDRRDPKLAFAPVDSSKDMVHFE